MKNELENPGNGLPLERFCAIVDAYGGRPEHWPAIERGRALNLLARSEEARCLRMAALDLDEVLDTAEPPIASSALAERILASVPAPKRQLPARRRGARRYLIAALPLAAAAALALWIVRPTASPVAVQVAVDLGQYDTPTDVLLDAPAFDITSSLPSLGCDESGLGCLDGEPEDELETRLSTSWRSMA